MSTQPGLPLPKVRVVTLPAISHKAIPLGVYVEGVKTALEQPETEFKHGLTTWWPTTGKEIRRQFLQSIHERINQGVPYIDRGRV